MSPIKAQHLPDYLPEWMMKLRKILKHMFETYCKTFKDVPPGAMF